MTNSFKIMLIVSFVAITIAIVYYSVPQKTEKNLLKTTSWIEVTTPHNFKNSEAENLSVKAFDLKKAGEFDQAIKVYGQAIQIEPDNPKLYFDISECYARKNLLQVAIVNLNSAILLDSSYPGFYNNRGFYYYQLYEDEKAIADFEKGIQLDNKLPSLYYNLSMCYYATNRFADACNAFRQSKESGLNIDDVEKQKEYKLISELCK